MTLPIDSLAAFTWLAVVSAARTTMSSNFSRPSLVTAMSAPVDLCCLPGGPARTLGRKLCKHRASIMARGRTDSLVLLEPTLFSAGEDSSSTHHVHASARPDFATVGLGQWPNHEQVPAPWLTQRQAV